MISFKNNLVIATGPMGFAGAGQILINYLHALSQAECAVVFVGSQKPFPLKSVNDTKIIFNQVNDIRSGAIGIGRAINSQDVLSSFTIAENLADTAIKYNNFSQIVLWGTYLFPYGYGALLAKEILKKHGISASLWITPAGSDVWEIGPQLKNTSSQLISNPQVDKVFTYTSQFAKEIIALFNLKRPIDVIPPIIDTNRFHPVSLETKLSIRKRLGISSSSFVICSHSNMRPVKHPEDVIRIALSAAKNLTKHVTLLMVGPKQDISNFAEPDNFCLTWTGVVHDVETWLWASDIELNCSSHDSFNLSLAEAMACGLPCITTDVVGISPEIESSKGGYLFQYLDPKGMDELKDRYANAVSYICSLAKNENLRRRIGANASKHISSVFQTDLILKKYFAALLSNFQQIS